GAGERTVVCAPGCDPLAPWGGPQIGFYRDPGTTYRRLAELNELDTVRPAGDPSLFLLVNERIDDDPKVRSFIAEHRLHPLIRGMPDAFIPILKLYGGFRTHDMPVLYGSRAARDRS